MDTPTAPVADATIGHNKAPEPTPEVADIALDLDILPTLLAPDAVRDALELRYGAHLNRRDELLDGVSRLIQQLAHFPSVARGDWPAAAKERDIVCVMAADARAPDFWEYTKGADGLAWRIIGDDDRVLRLLLPKVLIRDGETAKKVVAFTAQIKNARKEPEKDRAAAKDPFDEAAKAVQTFFKAGIIDILSLAATGLEGALSEFQRYQIAEEARVRREIAERIRLEAEAAEKEAARTESTADLQHAAVVAKDADRAERIAAAPVAETGRIRTGSMSGGAMATAITNWFYEVEDPALLPKEWWKIDHEGLAALARREKDKAAVPGVKFWSETKSQVRG